MKRIEVVAAIIHDERVGCLLLSGGMEIGRMAGSFAEA